MPSIDVPDYCKVSWPDEANVLDLQVEIKVPEGLWRGGSYLFKLAVPKSYPHAAPKATCLTPVKSKLTLDLSSKHRYLRKCLSKHPMS